MGEDMLQDEAAPVPDGVVFRILAQEFGGELEGGVGVVVGLDLRPHHIRQSQIAIDYEINSTPHSISDILLQCQILLNLPPLLLSCLLALV